MTHSSRLGDIHKASHLDTDTQSNDASHAVLPPPHSQHVGILCDPPLPRSPVLYPSVSSDVRVGMFPDLHGRLLLDDLPHLSHTGAAPKPLAAPLRAAISQRTCWLSVREMSAGELMEEKNPTRRPAAGYPVAQWTVKVHGPFGGPFGGWMCRRRWRWG